MQLEGDKEKKNLSPVDTGLEGGECKFQDRETEVSLAFGQTFPRAEVVRSTMGPPANSFTPPPFLKSPSADLH